MITYVTVEKIDFYFYFYFSYLVINPLNMLFKIGSIEVLNKCVIGFNHALQLWILILLVRLQCATKHLSISRKVGQGGAHLVVEQF